METNQDRPRDHRLFIAAADKVLDGWDKVAKTAFWWFILDPSGETLASCQHGYGYWSAGYKTKALLPAILEAAPNLPEGCTAHVVTDEDWLAAVLNQGPDGRAATGYRRTNGHALAQQEHWRELDALIVPRRVCLTAGRPRDDDEATQLERLKDGVKEGAFNIGNRPKEWQAR